MTPLLRDVGDLFDREFDVLIVGGGITGACAAWDAATRGMKVALIDSHDFASGASSNNLKLVHGGLRYVKRLQFREAREAIRERRTWQRIAPHLVEPIPILVPVYERSIQNPLFVRLLMIANDAVARDRNDGLSEDQHIAAGRSLSRAGVLDLVPQLENARLAGGVVFQDGQIRNTERLVLEVLRAARMAGAVLANYVALDGAICRGGAIFGARLTDRIGKAKAELRTRAIVNATGGDLPSVTNRLVAGTAPAAHAYSLAMNVMIPATGLKTATTLPSRPSPGQPARQLLWVPWRDREIIGTYHGDHATPSSRPEPQEAEIAAFLGEVNRSIPGLEIRRDDIVLHHAGTLPLVAGAKRADLRLLRRHRVIDHARQGAAGAVSVVSVKYTTGRLAAQDAVDRVQRYLGRNFGGCMTASTRLPAAPEDMTPFRQRATRECAQHLAEDIADHLVRTYGHGYERILAYSATTPDWDARVADTSPVIHAELVHGVRAEMAHTADDLLRRRTELGARGVSDNAVLARIARVLEHELGRHRINPLEDTG